MNSRLSMALLATAVMGMLAGCMNTPQTKALITPVGAIVIHSFAPPHKAPDNSNADFFERGRVARSEARQPATPGDANRS